MTRSLVRQFVVCIDNEGYPAALEKRKIYVSKRDPAAEKQGLVRVCDESGADYLYPKSLFKAIALPQSLKNCAGRIIVRWKC